MSNFHYFPNPAHYSSSHHIVRDDRGNTNSVFIKNSFQVNTPSTANKRKSKRPRSTPLAGTLNPHHFPPPPIGNNHPGHVVHFSENSHNVQTTHISNIGSFPGNSFMPPNVPHCPSTKKRKQRKAAPKVQNEDLDKETFSTSSFDEASSSSFDEAFSTPSRRHRRSHPAKPHAPSMSTAPPVPEPTRYLSAPYNTIPAAMPYYVPFGHDLSAMINASVQATMNDVNQVVHERIQEANARAIQAAGRTITLAARADKKAKTASTTATTKREDVPTTSRSPSCPEFVEHTTRDDSGNTITVWKFCSHADCAFMGDNFTPSSHGLSRSSNSWKNPDCNLACPGSVKHEETDNLGNVKVTCKLCSHEANPKETSDLETESDTDVESGSDSDDSDYERAKRASMQPSVQDALGEED